ncbi:prostaglandin D2 receptor 2-like [Osmerus eperlanus]|uniref:prostaglandin D2 receptor 2-like n=1 Tax=Osmerus eperlanus TaxID=29151 RepID=UPI002E100210
MSNSNLYCPMMQYMLNFTSNSTKGPAIVSLHGLISTLGILENVLILGVIGLRVRRTVISVWILNLAASDLLATASLPFFTFFMAQGDSWILGTTFCQIHSSIFFLNMFASGLLLAAISLDRCLVVMKPIWAQNHRDIKLVGRVCGLIWALSIICTIPFYVFRDTFKLRSERILCYYNYAKFLPEGEVDLPGLCWARHGALAVVKFIVAFLLPLVCIVSSYVMVHYRMKQRGHRCSFRFVRLVVAVVVSFVACWAPYHILSILEALVARGSRIHIATATTLPYAASFSFLNCVFNPVLYVFSCPNLCSKIRESFSAVLENVLAEDIGEMSRRRSTMRSSVSTSEILLRQKSTITPPPDQKEVNGGREEDQ